jgi:hypothetical protein
VACLAQNTGGNIVGRVLDTSGAGIPGVPVVATDQRTNVRVDTKTNDQGNYEILFLIPGTYRVTVALTGFKSFQQGDIEVRSGDRVPVDIELEVGDVSETVVVSATTPLVQTATTNVGQVVDTKNATDLPIPYGNPRTLFMLLPGVNQAFATGVKYQQATLPYISSYLSINGAPLGTTMMTLDGIPNVQAVNASKLGISNEPPVDSVGEVKVETAYDASVGYTTGATFEILLRSGTNQYHGTGYFFDREPEFYANSFFGNLAGQPVANFYDRRWGESFGGPLIIPKLYNGKNRTFFFYSLEQYSYSLPSNPYVGSVPTAQERNGDFSQLLTQGSSYQIYNPFSTVPAGNGRFSRASFPNNMIPASLISPIAQSINQYWPLPNTPGTSNGTNNYLLQNNPTPSTYHNQTVRVDHQFSEKYRISGHWVHSYEPEGPYNDYFKNLATGALFFSGPTNVMLDYIIIPNPNLVLDIRYGYNRHPISETVKSQGLDLTTLGFPSSLVQQLSFRPLQAQLFPEVDVAGLSSLQIFPAERYADDVHSFSVDVNRPIQNHGIKFGFDARIWQDNRYTYGFATPDFAFNPVYTNGPLDNSATSPGGVGQGYASFLLGIPTSGEVDNNASQAEESKLWAIYFQDNWRATPKLMVTMGLRYEYETPLTERYNRSVTGFASTANLSVTSAAEANYAANPIPQLAPSQFQPLGGLEYAGVNGQPRTLYNGDLRKFMPRVGLAYSPRTNTVLRAGYGIFFLPTGVSYGTVTTQTGYSQATPIVPSLNNGETYIASLANPFPNGIPSPTGNSLGVNTFLGKAITFFNPDTKSGYNQSWNFDVQHLFPGQVLIDVGYQGSRAVRLPIARNLDALPDQYLSTSPTRDQATINELTAQVPNPFYPLLSGTSLASQTVQLQQLLLPYPQFTSVTTNENQGYSWYHSLVVRGERRFSKGFSLLGAYTFSKLMSAVSYLNPGDPLPYRSIDPSDRRHHISISGIYELPFGAGRTFFSHAPSALSYIISGWQIAATNQLYSGQPLGFGGNAIFTGNPNNIQLPSDQRSIHEWFIVNAGFNTNSAQQLADNLMQGPLLFSGLRAPLFDSVDTSLIKNTKIKEFLNVQFRAEAFNVFNHPSFTAPNTTVTSQAFGTITAENSLPREIQLAIRLVF